MRRCVVLLVLGLMLPAVAAQPLVHVDWEGAPAPGHALWDPDGDCWSTRTHPGRHVETTTREQGNGTAVTGLAFVDGSDESACLVYRQALPPVGSARRITLHFVVADIAPETALWVRLYDKSGILAELDAGSQGHGRTATLTADLPSPPVDPHIEWAFHDRSAEGGTAARALVEDLTVRLSGHPPYVMHGDELTTSWLGAQLVVEHLWTFEVPVGPPGWQPVMELQVPQDFIVKGFDGQGAPTLHGADGTARTQVEGEDGAVLVRTLSPRLPAHAGALAFLFALSVVALCASALAAARQLMRMHLQRNAGIVPWAILTVALAVETVTVLRLVDGGTWRLMVQTPMHPVGILLYAVVSLSVLLNVGLLLWFVRTQNRSVSASLQERTQEADHLRRVNRALDEFAAGLAHDIKGPLAGARVALELALEDDDGIPAQKRKLLEESHRSISGLQRMAHQLLDLSELDDSSEPETDVDLREALDEACTLLEPSIVRQGAHFDIGLLPTVRARHLQVVRLFQNLIENALKHADSESLEITVRSTFEGPWRELTFADNGRGLPPGAHEQIFQAAHRGPGDGYGLGLAMVRRIVELHGGRIRADSAAGQGTTFTFTLPAGEPAPVPAPAPAPVTPPLPG